MGEPQLLRDVLADDALLVTPEEAAALYGDVLGLAVCREFGSPERRGVVFFLGNGLREVSGRSDEPPEGLALWLQVRDVATDRSACNRRRDGHTTAPAGAVGLVEMWIEDPDGVRIALVEVPEDHPLRRDQR